MTHMASPQLNLVSNLEVPVGAAAGQRAVVSGGLRGRLRGLRPGAGGAGGWRALRAAGHQRLDSFFCLGFSFFCRLWGKNDRLSRSEGFCFEGVANFWSQQVAFLPPLGVGFGVSFFRVVSLGVAFALLGNILPLCLLWFSG